MSGSPNTRQRPFIEDYDEFSRQFLAREDCLILIGQLNQLMKAVQRHRGISMGMLAGNTEFRNEFSALQRQTERRLATLEAFARANQLLSAREKENLSLAWQTICSNWEDDTLNDNFELHSHFIEQLLSMTNGLIKKLEAPSIPPLASDLSTQALLASSSGARVFQQLEILSFVGKLLPETIEQVARIRGTAVYAAALSSTEGLDERKLRFWVSSLAKHSEKLRGQADALARELAGLMPKLALIRKNELQLLQFLNTVETAVFVGKGGLEEAQRLFNMATDVIEVYWDVVNEGLAIIRDWHRQDLEAWVRL